MTPIPATVIWLLGSGIAKMLTGIKAPCRDYGYGSVKLLLGRNIYIYSTLKGGGFYELG